MPHLPGSQIELHFTPKNIVMHTIHAVDTTLDHSLEIFVALLDSFEDFIHNKVLVLQSLFQT